MARTVRRYPTSMVRQPRGRLQAIRAGARPGAVPPDAWDDLPHSGDCYAPQQASLAMSRAGLPVARITERLRSTWRLSHAVAREIADVWG